MAKCQECLMKLKTLCSTNLLKLLTGISVIDHKMINNNITQK